MRHLLWMVGALALLGCGEDELSGLSWWAGPERAGSLRDFSVIACAIGTSIDGTVAVTLNPNNAVVSSLRLVFPQNTPNERLLGADGASHLFFHDTSGAASVDLQTRYDVELGDIVPLRNADGTAFRDERAFIVHHLIIEPIEVTHPTTGHTVQMGGELRDLRLICDDAEASIATGGQAR
ncbi:MAG: hypothetical protein KC613_06470 [Myxococcales bacterium]|nr:hypothetical protein [Myxococcales bacterium]